MRLDFLTLFPEMFSGPLTESIIARARTRGMVEIQLINLRDFTHDPRRTVDDRPFGGGAGMVLKPEPLFEAVTSLRTPGAKVIMMTPQGTRFRQNVAEQLARESHLILICGHYEGVDERVRQTLADMEISLGDFILTSGNLAAMAVADAVIRLLPGVLGCDESIACESFSGNGLLEYPQYTRPAEFKGMAVPEVLMSGDHSRIGIWRCEQSLVRTISRRPEILCEPLAETNDESDSEKADPGKP